MTIPRTPAEALEFLATFLTFVAALIGVVALLVVLYAWLSMPRAGAQGACADRIYQRESASSGGYRAVNPWSGAYGKYQFVPYGGVYSETHFARDGRSVYSLSPAEQEQAFTEAVALEGYAPWGGC